LLLLLLLLLLNVVMDGEYFDSDIDHDGEDNDDAEYSWAEQIMEGSGVSSHQHGLAHTWGVV
jgi:hypothetical protein